MEDGIVLAPFCSWTVYNLYRCQKTSKGCARLSFWKNTKLLMMHTKCGDTIDDSDYMTATKTKKNIAYQKSLVKVNLLRKTIPSQPQTILPQNQNGNMHKIFLAYQKLAFINFPRVNSLNVKTKRMKNLPWIRGFKVDEIVDTFMYDQEHRVDTEQLNNDFGRILVHGGPPFKRDKVQWG